MTTYYPIVIETETNGAVSAYVPGLPVYAAADTRAKAEQAIRTTLAAYLAAHPDTVPTTAVRVARVSGGSRGSWWAWAHCWAPAGVSARLCRRN